MSELIFEVTQEEDGGFVAECLTEHIFTQADTWSELRHNVKEAVSAYHFDRAWARHRLRRHSLPTVGIPGGAGGSDKSLAICVGIGQTCL